MHNESYLLEIVIIIAIAVFVVAVFKKLKLSPVLGYFVAGGLLGENGMNIVTSTDTEFFGEIGIVFLLFAIGLELTFERLKSMRIHVFGFGTLQVVITMTVLGFSAYALETGLSAAVIIGGGLAK
jgi:CPA2 family monovalent cation:H+ antiporter-2